VNDDNVKVRVGPLVPTPHAPKYEDAAAGILPAEDWHEPSKRFPLPRHRRRLSLEHSSGSTICRQKTATLDSGQGTTVVACRKGNNMLNDAKYDDSYWLVMALGLVFFLKDTVPWGQRYDKAKD
jgi:hypothetical protein